MRSLFPMFRTDRAADMIRLLKLFRSERMGNSARMELARAIQNLSSDLVVTEWPKVPMPPVRPASLADTAPAQEAE